MSIKKMTQKQFEAHFKRKMKELSQNKCIFCKHNAACELPLHGKFRGGGEICHRAEHPDMEQYTAMVVEYFYGTDVKNAFMAKLLGRGGNG